MRTSRLTDVLRRRRWYSRPVSGRHAAAVRAALALAGVLLGGLATAGGAAGATQAPTFARVDHAQLGSIHVADFNGDGRPDLAGIGAQSAAVMLNSGAGGFGPRSEYPVASWAQDLAAGDFDGDGQLDLAVTITIRRRACRCWPPTATARSTRR